MENVNLTSCFFNAPTGHELHFTTRRTFPLKTSDWRAREEYSTPSSAAANTNGGWEQHKLTEQACTKKLYPRGISLKYSLCDRAEKVKTLWRANPHRTQPGRNAEGKLEEKVTRGAQSPETQSLVHLVFRWSPRSRKQPPTPGTFLSQISCSDPCARGHAEQGQQDRTAGCALPVHVFVDTDWDNASAVEIITTSLSQISCLNYFSGNNALLYGSTLNWNGMWLKSLNPV